MKKLVNIILVSILSLSIMLSISYESNAQNTKTNLDATIIASFDGLNESVPFDIIDPVYGDNIIVDLSLINSDGHQFAFWIIDGIVKHNLKVSDNQFILTNNLSIIAVFNPIGINAKHAVVFVDHSGKHIETKYVETGQVLEPAILPDKVGFEYGNPKWQSLIGSSSLLEISENTVFKLQYNNISSQNIDITLTNATKHAITATYNEVVTVSSELVGFTHWEENGKVVSYDNHYSFSALYNRELIAKSDGLRGPLITLSQNLNIRDGYLSKIAQVNLPESYELLEYGYLVSKTLGDLTLSNATIVKSGSMINNTKEYLTSIPNIYTNIRAYAKVKHYNEIIDIYSIVDVIPVTVNAIASDGSTTNMIVNENYATRLGLSQSIFTVQGSKGSSSVNVRMNQDELRLYSDRNSGDGNTLQFNIVENYEITNIKFNFLSTGSQTTANLKLDGISEDIIVPNTGYIERSNLKISSFSLRNTYLDLSGSKNLQIHIGSIEITYQKATNNTTIPNTYSVVLNGLGLTSNKDKNITENTEVIITVNPPINKELEQLVVDGVNVADQVINNQYRFNITKNVIVDVFYKEALITHQVNLIGEGLTANKTLDVPDNTEVLLNIYPPEGKKIDQLIVDGINVTSQIINNQYSFIINKDTTAEVIYVDDVIGVYEEYVYDFGTTSVTGYDTTSFNFTNTNGINHTLNKQRAQINSSSNVPHSQQSMFVVMSVKLGFHESFIEFDLTSYENISNIQFSVSVWNQSNFNKIVSSNGASFELQKFDGTNWLVVSDDTGINNLLSRLTIDQYTNINFNVGEPALYRIYYSDTNATGTSNTVYAITVDDFTVGSMTTPILNNITLQGEGLSASQTTNIIKGSEILLTVFVPSGKAIDQLFVDGIDVTNEIYNNNYTFNIIKDVIISISYILIEEQVFHQITFNSNGGSLVDSIEVLDGRTTSFESTPTKANYFFLGWYTDIELRNEFVQGETIVNSNLTLYAYWSDTNINGLEMIGSRVHWNTIEGARYEVSLLGQTYNTDISQFDLNPYKDQLKAKGVKINTILNNEITNTVILYVTYENDIYISAQEGDSSNLSGYYATAKDLEGELLVRELQAIISNYTGSVNYDDIRYLLEETDVHPTRPNEVSLIYNNINYTANNTWDSGRTWNREHVWQSSKLGTSRPGGSTSGIASDPHNLRAANPSVNSSRGNKYFANKEATSEDVLGQHSGDGYYPGDADKGDVARIMMYMALRYEGQISLTNNITLMTQGESPGALNYTPQTAYSGTLEAFYDWHFDDSVDAFEINRNQIIYNKNLNRNPFIDHPELFKPVYDYFTTIDNQRFVN